jgi:hypothetical protein
MSTIGATADKGGFLRELVRPRMTHLRHCQPNFAVSHSQNTIARSTPRNGLIRVFPSKTAARAKNDDTSETEH